MFSHSKSIFHFFPWIVWTSDNFRRTVNITIYYMAGAWSRFNPRSDWLSARTLFSRNAACITDTVTDNEHAAESEFFCPDELEFHKDSEDTHTGLNYQRVCTSWNSQDRCKFDQSYIINKSLMQFELRLHGKISNVGLPVLTSLSLGQYGKASVWYFPRVKTSLSVDK